MCRLSYLGTTGRDYDWYIYDSVEHIKGNLDEGKTFDHNYRTDGRRHEDPII